MSKQRKERGLIVTGADLRRLAHKHELKFNPDGSFALHPLQIREMLIEMSKRDIQRLDEKSSRDKWGRVLTSAHRKSIITTMNELAKVVQKYNRAASKKARHVVPFTSAYTRAREFGADSRQVSRWMNRATRPSKGLRKHLRNQKSLVRRA